MKIQNLIMDLKVITSNKLSKFKNISHGFFNRNGGISKGIYKSLNCGFGSKDYKKNIKKNLKIVGKKIGIKNKNLVLLNQIHSNKVFYIKEKPNKKLSGDGVITASKGIALGILTADCAPILIYDAKKSVIGAAHAGWKGAYKEIAIKLVNNFLKNGSKKENIVVAIGPCISQKSYEVGKEFRKKFLHKNIENKIFFLKKNRRILFNLGKYIKKQLINIGIKHIDLIEKDTFNQLNNFFSARYSLKNQTNDYGRNISIIMIK